MFFRAVLIKWAETRSKPYTWQTILDALSSEFIGHAHLARDIERQLMTDTVRQPPKEGSGNVEQFPAEGTGDVQGIYCFVVMCVCV